MNKRVIGARMEAEASAYLVENGMQIVARNYRNRVGEIDIIGYHEGYLVFVEVKYRCNRDKGDPAEAVNYRKMRTICKVADYYRYCNGISEYEKIRYDVIAICEGEINWYQNAFLHMR